MVTEEPGGTTDPNWPHEHEPHDDSHASRLNMLRAAVLGANDGIISTAGLVVGVAGADASRSALLVAGIAGLVAGSLSMAGGEYVSVSTQRDAEQALLDKERRELRDMPEEELAELAALYRAKGLSTEVANRVAVELTAHDALAAHAEVELGIDPEELVSPTQAAVSSMIAFALGAALPLLAIVLPPEGWRVPVTMLAVTIALVATGGLSAQLGDAPRLPAVVRTVAVGLLTMGLTFAVGTVVGPGIG
jgi:VIT1/CCC1 family predicted Fe2+/Mn2+ transporter